MISTSFTQKSARAFRCVTHESAPALQALLEIKSITNEIEAQSTNFELFQTESTISADTTGGNKKFALLERIEKIEMWADRYSGYGSQNKSRHAAGYVRELHAAKDRVVVAALELIRLKELGDTGESFGAQKNKLEGARQDMKRVIQQAVEDAMQEFQSQQRRADRAVSDAVQWSLLATFAAFGIAVFLGLTLSGWIAKPVIQLREMALAIERGDFSCRSTVLSRDEIGDLARGFNAMADQIQQEIRKRVLQEEKFRLVVESAPYGLLTVNAKGEILLTNSELEKMFGWQREELYGQPVEKLIPESRRSKHQQDREGFSAKPTARQMGSGLNLFGLHKDGHSFPVDVSLSPIHSQEGTIVLATIADLTERKKLENLVLQSEKMSAIGQLAAGVAHEINNPLGVILGFAQNMVKRVQPGDPLELPMRSIERESVRCKNLVQDLLTFSRVGKADKESLDIRGVVEGALSLVEAQTNVKNVTLTKEFSEIPAISVNRTQVQQIILNLCNNAVDAMPKGGTLTVRLQKSKINQKEGVEIQVQDTGQGIPLEIRSRIFEPFFTTKEIGKGTGLGLALVYEIIQKHNGQIMLDSEVGKGTLFRVFLPLTP